MAHLPKYAYDVMIDLEKKKIMYYPSSDPNDPETKTITLPPWLTRWIEAYGLDNYHQGQESVRKLLRQALSN